MRILGVDPGIATVGFAVLDAEKRSQRLLTCGVMVPHQLGEPKKTISYWEMSATLVVSLGRYPS